jgi:hypothetical protein
MFGQWCDPAGGAWLPGLGVVGVRTGVVEDVVVPLPVEVVVVDVAAFAIAAPPPAIAAVAATVTSRGLNLCTYSPPFSWTTPTFLARRRSAVGGA